MLVLTGVCAILACVAFAVYYAGLTGGHKRRAHSLIALGATSFALPALVLYRPPLSAAAITMMLIEEGALLFAGVIYYSLVAVLFERMFCRSASVSQALYVSTALICCCVQLPLVVLIVFAFGAVYV